MYVFFTIRRNRPQKKGLRKETLKDRLIGSSGLTASADQKPMILIVISYLRAGR